MSPLMRRFADGVAARPPSAVIERSKPQPLHLAATSGARHLLTGNPDSGLFRAPRSHKV